MSYQSVIIILFVFNILTLIAAWWLATRVEELEKELKNEKANKRYVMPFATIKAEFSEEDMNKIKESLNNWRTRAGREAELEEEKCKCDHFYDSVMLENDPKYCREKLIFRCGSCGHEEIIPISQGLLVDLIRKGGRV